MKIVKTSDGETVEVEDAIAEQFDTLMQMKGEEGCDDGSVFPVPNVTSKILAKIIEYCKHRTDAADKVAAVAFDAQLQKELKEDSNHLFELIKAANYLNIKSLFNFTCQVAAELMMEKSIEEIRKIFHINNDYTQMEEDEIRRDNAWAFEE